MDKRLVPRSEAETAYELCEDICRIMLRQPARCNMNYYVRVDTDKHYDDLPALNRPECGVVGCFAGWGAVALGLDPQVLTRTLDSNPLGVMVRYGDIRYRVTEYSTFMRWVLGQCSYKLHRPSVIQGYEHTSVHVDVFDDGRFDIGRDYGTRGYAERVVKRIQEFMGRNESILRARNLREVRLAVEEANAYQARNGHRDPSERT